MDTQIALHFFKGSQMQIERMLSPIPDERLAEQPNGVRNHPAWTLAHLCTGIDFGLQLLGQPTLAPKEWSDIAGIDTIPTDDRSRYPSKDELFSMYAKGHDTLDKAVRQAGDDVLSAEMPVAAFRDFFPTIAHGMTYFLLCHEPTHMGQLAVWRRAAGFANND